MNLNIHLKIGPEHRKASPLPHGNPPDLEATYARSSFAFGTSSPFYFLSWAAQRVPGMAKGFTRVWVDLECLLSRPVLGGGMGCLVRGFGFSLFTPVMEGDARRAYQSVAPT